MGFLSEAFRNRLQQLAGINEGMFTGFKKTFSLDTTYQTEQQAWNAVVNYCHKKYPGLELSDGMVKNGPRTIPLKIERIWKNKQLQINGKLVNMDDLLTWTDNFLKSNKMV